MATIAVPIAAGSGARLFGMGRRNVGYAIGLHCKSSFSTGLDSSNKYDIRYNSPAASPLGYGLMTLTSPLFCKYNLTRSCFNMSKRGLAITGRASKNAAPKKNKLDLMKTKLYARIGIKIVMAAKKEGGTDPKANKELAQALHTAHVNNLPKENIERALRRASEKAPEDYKSGVYEVFGHGGVGIIVTTLSDNSNRANNLVKMTAKKADAKMAASGSVLFSFDYKGVVRVNFPYKEDDIIELALEAGVDEVDFAEIPSDKGDESSANYKAIITDTSTMVALQEAISGKYCSEGNTNKVDAEFEYIPKERVEIDDETYDLNMKLIEGFEDLDDVDACYHNIA